MRFSTTLRRILKTHACAVLKQHRRLPFVLVQSEIVEISFREQWQTLMIVCQNQKDIDKAKLNKKIEIFTKIFASFLFTIYTTPPTTYTLWRTNDEVEK